MSTQARLDVEQYLARTRAALADLPAAEVAEIMEDVSSHVAEIAGELGEDGTLEQRLGTPEAYALELRAAAGYPAPVKQVSDKRNLIRVRLGVWGLAAGTLFTLLLSEGVFREPAVLLLAIMGLGVACALVAHQGPALPQASELPEVRRLAELLDQPEETNAGRALAYLRSLQPAWWLLRAGVLFFVALMLLSSRDLFGAVMLVAIGAASVYAASRVKADRRWLWLTLPVSALAIGMTVQLADEAYGVVRASGPTPAGSYRVEHVQTPYDNIYVFDANGKQLSDVLLFDQDGRAINAPRQSSCPGEEPFIPANRYPRPKVDYEQGTCRMLPPSAPTTPSSQPSASASAVPSASVPPSPAPPTPSK